MAAENGRLLTGWICAVKDTGAVMKIVATGSKALSSKEGNIYYIDPGTKRAARGTTVIGGKKYLFLESSNAALDCSLARGEGKARFVESGSKKYIVKANGEVYTGWFKASEIAPLDNKTYEEFKTNYIETSPSAERFNEEKALTSEWKSIDILFQLTDDSFTGQQQLFDSKLNPLNPQSYLCFAVGLNNNEYSKTQIASITREVNKDTINLSIRGLHFQLSTNCRQFNSIFRVTALLHFEPIITQMHTVS